MAISEEQRHHIHEAFKASHGNEVANGLMEMLPPVGWADVATKHDLDALEERIDLRFEALEARLETRFERIDARFERIDARFEQIDQRFADGDTSLEQRFALSEARMEAVMAKQTVRFVRWVLGVATVAVGVTEGLSRLG